MKFDSVTTVAYGVMSVVFKMNFISQINFVVISLVFTSFVSLLWQILCLGSILSTILKLAVFGSRIGLYRSLGLHRDPYRR